jgi:hypothetical protein
MVEWARWFLLELPLFTATAICTHLVMSGGQTLFHYGFGHHKFGGIFFRNHIRFHHGYYAKGHLVSSAYRRNEGNNTPYFLLPTILVAAGMFVVLPLNLFVVMSAASAASFGAHVYWTKHITPKDRTSHASLGSGASSSFTLSTICTPTAISQ